MIDGAAFRDAMARFAEPVTVVATDGPAGLAGLTATSIASVSDDPPTVLVCLNLTGRSLPKVIGNGVFSINLLAADQRDIALAFSSGSAGTAATRFSGAEWRTMTTGAPVLSDALVGLDCRVVDAKEVGTHVVLFGAVVAVARGVMRSALVYAERDWHRLDLPVGELSGSR